MCRELLLTAGIDPGNKSGLQKLMNAAWEIIVDPFVKGARKS